LIDLLTGDFEDLLGWYQEVWNCIRDALRRPEALISAALPLWVTWQQDNRDVVRPARILKVLGISAAAGYAVAVALYIAPGRWELPPMLVFSLCPSALASFTVDPSASSVAFFLAPINAIIYAVVGTFGWLAYKECRTEISKYKDRRTVRG